MRRIRISSIVILLIAVLCISCGRKNAESTALTEYLATAPDNVRTLYFYPSTIRMLAGMLGDETGASLNEIKRGRLSLTFGGGDTDFQNSFDPLKTAIDDDGFTSIMKLNAPDGKIDIFYREEPEDGYLLFIDQEGSTFILEITGEISMQTIQQLSTLDMGRAMGLLNIQFGGTPNDSIPENDGSLIKDPNPQ